MLLACGDQSSWESCCDAQEDRLRDKLKDMSKTRMSGWNNTLEARRKQKESLRQTKVRSHSISLARVTFFPPLIARPC